MKTATAWFEAYGESHQNGTNKLIHWVCIPVIYASTLGLLQALPLPFEPTGAPSPYVSWALPVIVLLLAFYFSISLTIGLGMAALTAAAYAGNVALAQAGVPLGWVCAGAFLVAWAFQFVGHRLEGKKPSFFEDLRFLAVGPAWLLRFVYRRLGVPVGDCRRSAAARA